MDQIPHSRPWITDSDISAVASVLASSMIGQGDGVRRLERRLAAWTRFADGIAAGSGSAAIVLALHGLRIGVGDEVILPTYVCRSVLEATLAVGATPVLCDAGPDWVMTVADAERVAGPRSRVVIVPHLYGIFADIGSFRRLGIPVIEDCAQALAGEDDRAALSDVAVLSFHPTKCLAAGEGGMALASDPQVLERMRACRDGNQDRFGARLFSPLSDIAAGLVWSQLDRYGDSLARRREIARRYRAAVDTACPAALNLAATGRSMFFRFPLRLPGGLAACQQAFAQAGVQVRKGVDALLHRGAGRTDAEFPAAVEHFEKTVSLPIYPALTPRQESRCVDAISQILPHYCHS